MSFLKFLWAKHPFASVAFALALGGLVVFGSGFVRDTLYFNDPAHRNQDLEPWMTPRYVVRVYDLPPEDVSRVLGLSPGTAPRLTLERIAETQGRPLAQVLADLDALRPKP